MSDKLKVGDRVRYVGKPWPNKPTKLKPNTIGTVLATRPSWDAPDWIAAGTSCVDWGDGSSCGHCNEALEKVTVLDEIVESIDGPESAAI